jgi:hypothetical protein
MYAKEAHKTQPEMEHKVVERHVWLGDGNDLPKHWQRLPGTGDRKDLVKPEARAANLVEVKSHRYEEKPKANQSSLCKEITFLL